MTLEIQETPKKWVRSNDGILAGVFEGLGRSFNIDPKVLRVAWIISVLFFGSGFLFYLLLWLILPRLDEIEEYYQPKILGVCLRIADHYRVDLGLVRLLMVSSLFISFGFSFIIYIVLWVVLPKPSSKLYY